MQPAPDRGEVRLALAETLRKLRRDAHIAQEKLALECGVNRAYMSALERGLHTPTLEMILRMLPVLGVTFSDFAKEFERALRRIQRKRKL